MNRAEEIIETLGLIPHPEGGYFKETYRSDGEIKEDSLSPNFNGKRNYSTSIYFLLKSGMISAFHRIKQDEIWHFHEGSTIELHSISPNGNHMKYRIGMDLANGERPQLIVPAHHWFAAKVIAPKSFALVGCTVSPGFDFKDFELPARKDLLSRFPQHQQLIKEFTKS